MPAELAEALLELLSDQQWQNVAELLFVQSPNSIYVASMLRQLHAQLEQEIWLISLESKCFTLKQLLQQSWQGVLLTYLVNLAID